MDKEIFRLAIPNIISNISIPLLSSVDILLMGKLSADHLGAVGIGAMIFNLIYWNFGFLRMGTTGITAQAYGKQDAYQIINTLVRALSLAFFIAILIGIFYKPIQYLAFLGLNVLESQEQLIAKYFIIRLFAAPATLGIYALNGWLFGMQNARFPLYGTILVNLINILLSYYLVHYHSMTIEGVAWGTVIAQYFGLFFLSAVILLKFKSQFKYLSFEKLRNLNPLLDFLNINKDLFIRTIFLSFAFAFFYSQSSKMGALILGANLIALQFLNWMSYGIDGFAYAAESLVGKYKGEGNQQKLNAVIGRLIKWGFILALFYTGLFACFGNKIMLFFTNDLQVIETTKTYLNWIYILPLMAFASYMWDGIYVGLTASKAMRDTMFLALITYLAVFIIAKLFISTNHALWLSLSLFLAVRGLIQYLYFNKKNLANLE